MDGIRHNFGLPDPKHPIFYLNDISSRYKYRLKGSMGLLSYLELGNILRLFYVDEATRINSILVGHIECQRL